MVMITICGGVPVDFTKDADGQVYFLDGKLIKSGDLGFIYTKPISNTNM